MGQYGFGGNVVVLGAGATKDAAFLDYSEQGKKVSPEISPPLNADFFTQLQRIRRKYRPLVQDVVRDVLNLYGPGFDLTLEDYFSQLDFLDSAISLTTPSASHLSRDEVREMRDRLLRAVSAVLELSTVVGTRGGNDCRLHRSLVEHLEPPDAIISFNYDCVIDSALRSAGAGKWAAKYGYLIPAPHRIDNVGVWDAENPPGQQKTIRPLKLHGSLNWQLPPITGNERIKLKERLYEQNGPSLYSIIPPTWAKMAVLRSSSSEARAGTNRVSYTEADLAEEQSLIYAQLWKNALRALRLAKTLVVAGFSFTPVDSHVEALFRIAQPMRNLRTVVIANPSQPDRRRIRTVLSKSLERGVIVTQFDSFKDFANALPECLT